MTAEEAAPAHRPTARGELELTNEEDSAGRTLRASFSLSRGDDFRLVFELSFDISVPRVLVLFGPSGVGKTTALRCLAGLTVPEEGTVFFGKEVWFDSSRRIFVPPERRHVGFVHQRSTLFPHLDVAQNVAYGSGVRGTRARTLARRALAEFDAEVLVEKKSLEVSGGEAQLVCLARALASKPRLFMGDEPLSSLDLVRRPLVGRRIREALKARGLSAVLVTHDIEEAIEVGDEIAVMIDGRIAQKGAVEDVVTHPVDADVARAVGLENLLPGVVTASSGEVVEVRTDAGKVVAALFRDSDVVRFQQGDVVYVSIPASEIALARHPLATESPRNRFDCVVARLRRRSGLVAVELECASGATRLEALITPEASSELELEGGRRVAALAKATSVRVIPDGRST